jgi:hypothetical protein
MNAGISLPQYCSSKRKTAEISKKAGGQSKISKKKAGGQSKRNP